MTVVSAVSLGIVVLAFGWPKHDRPVDRCASTLRVDGYSHITDEYSRSFSSVKTYWIGPSSADPSRLVTQPGFDVRAVADGARLGAYEIVAEGVRTEGATGHVVVYRLLDEFRTDRPGLPSEARDLGLSTDRISLVAKGELDILAIDIAC
jgi:hypothetical protein